MVTQTQAAAQFQIQTKPKRKVHFEDLRFLDDSEREQELQREEELAWERGEKRKEKEEVRKQRMKEKREK